MSTDIEHAENPVPFKKCLPIILSFCVIFICVSVLGGCSVPAESEILAADPLSSQVIIDSGSSLLLQAYEAAEAFIDTVPEPVYEIAPDALLAPSPNPECYGSTDDPGTLQWLLDDAAKILDGQETLFQTDIEIYEGTEVTYYLDKTIFAISWKQVIDKFIYTFAEVKVAHPSQFRRYLVNNEYDSIPLYTTAKMAPMINAVVASGGDYYRGRKFGITVYEGTVRRFNAPEKIDTCFVDRDGNLILKPAGTFSSMEEAQQFVDENDISFSLAFGPILVNNGLRCEPDYYGLGEVNEEYPRAALCQRDELHYVVVTANGDGVYWNYPTIHDFAENIGNMGFETAYSLDGGNTGTIVMNNTVQNPINPRKMRAISDCLYFASALPDEE